MASQSAIAEGSTSKIVTSDCIDYRQLAYSHPDYKFSAVNPNTFGAPISLTSSQTPISMNIGPDVFNLSESLVNYTTTLPAVPNQYIWYHQNGFKEVSRIQFYSSSAQMMADIDGLQNYIDIVCKKELSADEFCSQDLELTGIGPSNSPVNTRPALRNANILNVNTPALAANESSVNYTEPAYFKVGGFGLPVTYNTSFPLRLIKNTIFSMDKSLFYGQTTYLRLYFGPLAKVCYTSDTNASPSAGIKLSYVGAATISNLTLMLAIEGNTELVDIAKNVVNSGGQQIMIPYVSGFKNPNNGARQNVSIQLDGGSGKYLSKVYHSVYNVLEDLDCAYDHSNNSTVSGVLSEANNMKIQQYYTTLNTHRIQDITIDCTSAGPDLDYMQHKKQLRGSILANNNIYKYNWFHCDDFSAYGSEYDQHGTNDLIAGVKLGLLPVTWGFVGLAMRPPTGGPPTNNASFQHYTWFVLFRKLNISLGAIIVE